MKTIVLTVSVLLIAASASRLATPHITKAASSCGVSSLQGSYGFSSTGFYIAPDSSTNLVSAVGRITADGSGSLAGVESISGNGNVNRAVQYTGTYTVNSDCTGTVTFSDGSSPLDFVVTAGGNSLHFMAVGQGFNLTGTADRQ